MEESNIPPSFYQRLRLRVLKKIVKNINDQGCWEWVGRKKKGSNYGTEVICVGGRRRTVNAHRAVFIAYSCKFHLPHDISHLCHNPCCVNPLHLSHEPHSINADREVCREEGECCGHQSGRECYKECLLKEHLLKEQ